MKMMLSKDRIIVNFRSTMNKVYFFFIVYSLYML